MALIKADSDDGQLKGNTFLENLPSNIRPIVAILEVSEDLKTISVVIKTSCFFNLPKQQQVRSISADQKEGTITIVCEDEIENLCIHYIVNYKTFWGIIFR